MRWRVLALFGPHPVPAALCEPHIPEYPTTSLSMQTRTEAFFKGELSPGGHSGAHQPGLGSILVSKEAS